MSREIVMFEQALATSMRKIESVLPDGMNSRRFCRMAIGQVERTPALRSCTPQSFALAVMGCAELGLEPALGMAYIVPFKETATLIIGYQGMIQLARNSGQVLDIWANVVREGDDFEVTQGTERRLHHVERPGDGEDVDARGITHAYACAVLKGTDRTAFLVMTRSEIDKRMAVSKSAHLDGSVAQAWGKEYCQKTVVRAFFKYLPKSTQMQAAAIMDDDGAMGKQTRPMSVPARPEPLPWEQPAEPDACPADTPFDGTEDEG